MPPQALFKVMDASFFSWLPLDAIEPLMAAFDSQLLLAGFLFVVTATLVAMCVPGVLIPMSLSSGALLGPWGAAAVVGLGALAGSQLFFIGAKRLTGERLRSRMGTRLQGFERRFARHGIWYIVGLRLVGAPHLFVAGGSALMSMRASTFAIATFLGFLPAIAIAAATGSAI